MSLLSEVGARLTAAGVASTASSTGWLLKYRGLPPTPSRALAVSLTGGFQQEGQAPLNRPTFQVLIRGSSDDGAALETQVERVVNALNCQSTQMSGWVWVDCQLQGDVQNLGWDENQRPLYSANFLALRSRTS